MEVLDLLMPLEKYWRNIILQCNTEYCLLHVRVKYLTERTEKKLMTKHYRKKKKNNTLKQWSQQRKNIIGEKTIQGYEI